MPPEQINPNEDILVDATLDQNEKLSDIAQSNEVQVEGIMETNNELKELNSTADILVEMFVDKMKDIQKVSLDGVEKVIIKGEKGDMPVKGVDYLTPEELEEVKNKTKELVKEDLTPVKGKDYFDGKDGRIGPVGPQGPAGLNGKDGENGRDGKNGIDGADGRDGKQGPKGLKGKDGSPDTGKEIISKIRRVPKDEGLKYEDITDAPKVEDIIRSARIASKTTSLVEIDDVDYSGLSFTNGKYILGSGGGGGSTWGSITGTLSAQTDLQSALDAKLSTIAGSQHDLLAGLLDDDHTQYALLAGRATPQQFAFGTASGASTGYLTSTANATKGKYFLNSAGTITVDELNARFLIGTASTVNTSALEVYGASDLVSIGRNSGTDDTDTHQFTVRTRSYVNNNAIRLLDRNGAVSFSVTDQGKLKVGTYTQATGIGTGYVAGFNGAIDIYGATAGFQVSDRTTLTTKWQHYSTAGIFRIFNLLGAAASEPFNITASTGNVAIGHATGTSATRRLDIVDGTNNYQLRIGSTGNFTYDIGRDNSNGYFIFYGNQTGANGYIFTGINGERMRIDTSGNVMMGIAVAGAKLHTVSTTEQLRVGYDSTNYYSTTVGSTGLVTLDAVGAGAGFVINDNVGIGATTVSGVPLRVHNAAGALNLRMTNGVASTYRADFGLNTSGVGYFYNYNDSGGVYAVLQFDGNPIRMNATTGGNVVIGNNTATAKFNVYSTTEQLRVGYDASNYLSVTVDSAANTTFSLTASAGTPEFTFSDPVNVPDEAYGAGWNGNTEVPTKNAVYDKIETIVAGTAFTWTEVTGTTQAMAVNNGYIANNAALITLTLPTTAAVGSIVRVTGKGAGGWRIAQNASEQIIWNEGGVDGTNETTIGTGGRLDSTDDYDSIELICLTADTTWGVLSVKGNISLT